jgi:YggT family protein
MSILGLFVESIAHILGSLIFAYMMILIIGAILSFVNPDPYNPLVQMIYRLTEPVYAYIRKYIPTYFNGIDFAPLILILILQFIDLFFVKLLLSFAQSL